MTEPDLYYHHGIVKGDDGYTIIVHATTRDRRPSVILITTEIVKSIQEVSHILEKYRPTTVGICDNSGPNDTKSIQEMVDIAKIHKPARIHISDSSNRDKDIQDAVDAVKKFKFGSMRTCNNSDVTNPTDQAMQHDDNVTGVDEADRENNSHDGEDQR